MVQDCHHFPLRAASFIGVFTVVGDVSRLVGGEERLVLAVHVGASCVSQLGDTGAPPLRWLNPSATALSRGRVRSESIGGDEGYTGRAVRSEIRQRMVSTYVGCPEMLKRD